MTKPPVCLTIAGLDPSGGAGIIADIKTFSAFGCFAAAAVSSITFQNTRGVFGAEHVSAAALRKQVEPVFADYEVAAVKTGMLPSREVIEETARLIGTLNGNAGFVVDPVVRSTSGFDLIDDEALSILTSTLFPLSDLITPNKPEAERITGIAIETLGDVEAAAKTMASMGARNVLIKGGHFEDGKANDYLFLGDKLHVLEGEFIDTSATHGTGCTLAAAITANLALGKDLLDAVRISKDFVAHAIRTAPMLGHGHSPINIS